uniref:DUF4371 domain-containing protein n=1 Tax=Parastrongyloides trichosuri TaxID=131310 RepID=A0A0N4Z744_PARTI
MDSASITHLLDQVYLVNSDSEKFNSSKNMVHTCVKVLLRNVFFIAKCCDVIKETKLIVIPYKHIIKEIDSQFALAGAIDYFKDAVAK